MFSCTQERLAARGLGAKSGSGGQFMVGPQILYALLVADFLIGACYEEKGYRGLLFITYKECFMEEGR